MKYIDLHNHLDGSLPPRTILELGKMSGVELPANSVEEIKKYSTVSPDCRDLTEYLEKFALPVAVLQTEPCLEKAVYDTMRDLNLRDVAYAELRFAPGQHLQRGLNQEQVVEAAVKGLNRAVKDFPICGQLILCCMRGANEAVNKETIDVTKKYLGNGVCCADLAGAEALFPTAQYKGLFAYAVEQGVPFVIHAGEADGPQSMWDAIEMGAKRIGHGIAAVQDEKLMDYLKEHQIPLEVCVTSNVQTKGVSSAAEHPILKLLEYGIPVTINTDNMTVSGTNLKKEHRLIAETVGMSELQQWIMLENAIQAAFLNDGEKAALRAEIFA